MKNELFKKAMKMALITQMMSPGFMLWDEEPFLVKEQERTKTINIESFEVSDGEEEAKYLYGTRNNRNRLVLEGLETEEANVYIGFQKSRLNIIEHEITITFPNGTKQVMKETEYVFELNEKLIEEEQSGTATEE